MPTFLNKHFDFVSTDIVQAIILLSFFFPLFFQLFGSIFTATDIYYDSQNLLLRLPLPLAAIICFIGIVFTIRLEKRHFGMGVIFSTFMLMMLSIILTTAEPDKTKLAKFILLGQFVLPMFAFVFGSLYLKPKSVYLSFEAVALYMLLIIIPLEVTASVLQGSYALTPNLYIFSLYQYHQYLPVVFIGLYFLTATALYKNNILRYLILFLTPWMGIYLAKSISLLTVSLAILGVFIFIMGAFKNNKKPFALTLVTLLLIFSVIYYPVVNFVKVYLISINHELQSSNKVVPQFPHIFKTTFPYWDYYWHGIFDELKQFFFGHQSSPDHSLYPSAHNYYLDLIYNFGFLTMLPFGYLIVNTLRNFKLYIGSKFLTANLLMLFVIVMFSIFVDNSFKVSFRQPYPGMVMFFLWGVLSTRLLEFNGILLKIKKNEKQ